MFETRRKAHLSGTLIALAGLALCLYGGIFQAEALCFTSGCALFRDITIAGISPWWAGAGAFGITALLCMIGRTQMARGVAMLMLLGDLLFLFIMIFTAPCIPCLCAALIIIWLYWTLTADSKRPQRMRTALALIWLSLFTPNIFATAGEMTGGWIIHGPEQAALQIYFSPSCPACKEAVLAISQNNPQQVAYFPVAESTSDLLRIKKMQEELKAGRSVYAAFRTSITAAVPLQNGVPPAEVAMLQWRTLQNKARLARMGITTIPAIVTAGKPARLGGAEQGMSFIPDPAGGFAGCSEQTDQDCDDTGRQPAPLLRSPSPSDSQLDELFDNVPEDVSN